MPGYYCFDGKFIPSDDFVIGPDSRALRYGDGLFETIRMEGEKIPLWPYHANRLFHGIQTLAYSLSPVISPLLLQEKIIQLCRKNNLTQHIRIRLMFCGGDGGINDHPTDKPHY